MENCSGGNIVVYALLFQIIHASAVSKFYDEFPNNSCCYYLPFVLVADISLICLHILSLVQLYHVRFLNFFFFGLNTNHCTQSIEEELEATVCTLGHVCTGIEHRLGLNLRQQERDEICKELVQQVPTFFSSGPLQVIE